jgi:hypothetical protein
MGARHGSFDRCERSVAKELLDLKPKIREGLVEYTDEAKDGVAAVGLAAWPTSSASAAHGSASLSRSLKAAMCLRITSLASGISSTSVDVVAARVSQMSDREQMLANRARL